MSTPAYICAGAYLRDLRQQGSQVWRVAWGKGCQHVELLGVQRPQHLRGSIWFIRSQWVIHQSLCRGRVWEGRVVEVDLISLLINCTKL